MSFDKDKETAMKKLERVLRDGEVDKDLIVFLNEFNKLEDYYTTSSCSGRYQLISFKFNGENLEFKRILTEHDPEKEIELPEYWQGYLMLLVEPPIFHIVARNLERANQLLHLAREAGFKRSGIRSIKENRIVIELLSTEFLKMPIGKEGTLYEKCYNLGIEIGKKLLQRGKEKIQKFEKLIKRELLL